MTSLISPSISVKTIPTSFPEMLYNNDKYSAAHLRIPQMLNTYYPISG